MQKTGEKVVVTLRDGSRQVVENAIRVHTANFRAELYPTPERMEERLEDGPNFRPHVKWKKNKWN